VPSASSLCLTGIAAAALTGCSTTQQEAARLQLNSARIRATELPLQVAGRSTAVSITSVAMISSAQGSAIVVTLHNRTGRAVSDLPLLVGATSHRHRRYLNDAAGLNYFTTHAPSIPAYGLLRWVLIVGRRLPGGTVPCARVGAATGDTALEIGSLPRLRVSLSRALPGGAILTVQNPTSVPQYQLPVYAIATRNGRYVAAGQVTIGHLGTGSDVRLRVPLVGDLAGAALTLEAPPTIFN
jgi:hypothetical protein